ncbi:MAG: SIMPL domain-containing protein [bacterium]|nr:SIMPL domain-containing protein [bacterium]
MDREWLSSQKTVKTAAIIFIAFATVFLFVLTIGTVRSWNESDAATGERPQITVLGTGEVTKVPDIAEFTFTVQEEGKTTKEAQDKATAKANAAIAYLKESKIEDKDIKTIGYNVNPKYEYRTTACIAGVPCVPGNQVLIGYEVSQSVQVKVRDTSVAGNVLSGIGNLSVSNVSGLNLTIDDKTELEREARQKAIDDAEAKARALAGDLNVRLVRITNFQETTNGIPPIYYGKESVMNQTMDSRGAAAPAPQLPGGENTITSNVTITYEIR